MRGIKVDSVIVEPNPSGHRFQFVVHLADHLLDSGCACTLLTSIAGRESAESQLLIQPLVSRGLRVVVSERLSPGVMGMRRVRAALDELGDASTKLHLLWPDGDHQALPAAWALRRSVRHSGAVTVLALRDPKLRAARGTGAIFRALLKKASLRTARRLGAKVVVLAGPASTASRGSLLRLATAPDPVVASPYPGGRASARLMLGLDAETTLIGLFGGIGRRKHPELVFDAARLLSRRGDHLVQMLVVGPVSAEVREIVDRAVSDGIVAPLVDAYVPDDLLDAYISASSVAAVLYSDAAPSGILARAATLGTPAIGGPSRWLAPEVLRLRAGFNCRLEVSDVAAAVERAVGYVPNPPPMANPEDFTSALLGRRGLAGDTKPSSRGGRSSRIM